MTQPRNGDREPGASAPRDLVGIGSMVLDRLHRVPRIPGAEEKVLLTEAAAQDCVGGLMLNQLGWARVLGLRTGIFGRQADDAPGRFLRAAMDRLGIERHLVLDGSASSTAELLVDAGGERAIVMAPGATAETDAEHVRRHHADFIRSARRVSTEISQLPLAAVRAVLEIASDAGIPTALDFDVLPADAVPALGSREDLEAALRAASLLKPAKAAARAWLRDQGEPAPDDALALAEALRARLGNELVVVTDGAAGAALSGEGLALRTPAAPAKAVVDSTGAGDAFLGGLLAGLHHGLPVEAAARLAAACGAACVEKPGAFPDDPFAAYARIAELYDGPALPPSAEPATPPRPGTGALAALGVAVDELAALRERARGDAYERATELVREAEAAGGRVHVTGVGKPEHLARYAASLLASTGTPASFLHATEAVHGSAGQVLRGDVVIAISNSGETAELLAALAAVRALGARILAVTGVDNSTLARRADVVLDARVTREGGGLDLAPRASAAAELLVLAALSAALEEARGFTRAEYHARHPAGALGEKART